MSSMARGCTLAASIWLSLLLACSLYTVAAASLQLPSHERQLLAFAGSLRGPQLQAKHHTVAQDSHVQQNSQYDASAATTAAASSIPAATAAAAAHDGRILQQQQPHQTTGSSAAKAGAAVPLPEITIPRPPPGQNIPAEPLVPLYSPDQLRLRLPVIDDVPLESQIISLMEQMQQAAHLNKILTPEQLQNANPLLGKHGVLQLSDRTDPKQYPEGYVAICAIVKNQHKDLREWLEYHKYIGVQKVYIYDNNSTEPLSSSIQDFMQSGFVEYSFFVGMPRYRDLFRTSSQWWAYNDCVTRYRYRHRWLAFIDADEFIVFHDGTTNINTFMQNYDKYGGLALNWVVFGSSGHKQRPRGGVLVNYKQCLPYDQEQNRHVKVIANTAHLMTVGDDPHRVYYKDKDYYTVNELGQQVMGPKSAPSHTKIALYHYLTKSEGEYMQKMKRGSAAGNYKSPEFFYAINGLATSTCTRAVPLGLKCCPSVIKELGPEGVMRVQQEVQAAAAPGVGAQLRP